MRQLCRRADLILPNATEAGLLLEKELPAQLDEEGAGRWPMSWRRR
mgnify:CR=1 FL=1